MKAKNYPYSGVTGSLQTAMGATARNLEKVQATDVFMSPQMPEVYFRLNDKPFVIKIPIGVFMRLNGGDAKLAVRQGWSALRDYVKGLVIIAQCTMEDGEAWRAMIQHLLAADGQTTAAELILRGLETGRLQLASGTRGDEE